MLTQTEHINTRKNHGVHVYHDTSVKKRYTTKDGRKRVIRHDCWRADITIIDQRGYNRVRRRFKDRNEAMSFMQQFNSRRQKDENRRS